MWRWNSGSLLSYSNWAPDSPDNVGGNQNCAYLVATRGLIREWDDQTCDREQMPLCMKVWNNTS